MLVDSHCKLKLVDKIVSAIYNFTNCHNARDQAELHHRYARHCQHLPMGLQSAEGISSRMGCLRCSGDKDGQNLHSSQCQARATLLWAGGTVHEVAFRRVRKNGGCSLLEWSVLTCKSRPPAAFHIPSAFCEEQIGATNLQLVVSPEKASRR